MPPISIIVPVYNVETYLAACVDSILAQTFKDFECILIDDGSQDGSSALCDAYAVRDTRIRVIHQKNAGVSAARNTGLQMARGKWLAFVDADDCVHPEFLELLYGAAQSHQAQIACCSHWEMEESGGMQDKGPSGPAQVFSGRQALTEHYRHSHFPFTVWGKLYARSLMKHVRFPEGLNHEDEFFHNHALPFCHSVVLIPERLYAYRLRVNSFMRKTFSESRLDIFTVNHDAFTFLKEQGFEECLFFVAKEFWRRFHHYGRRAVKNRCLNSVREQELLGYCREVWNAGYPPRHPLIKLCVRLFLFPYSRSLFYRIYATF